MKPHYMPNIAVHRVGTTNSMIDKLPPTPSSSTSSTLADKMRAIELHHQASDDDYALAQRLMEEHRIAVNKQSSSEFSYKDANPVLDKIARGQVAKANASLVQALLEYGATVSIARPKSTSIWKSIVGKNQQDIRSRVLEDATRNCSTDIVHLLAQQADEIAVTQALPVAIREGDAVKTSILLARGADGSQLCEEFIGAVEAGSEDLVEVLLRENRGACARCRNIGLVRAAADGNIKKVSLLLAKGADATFDGAAALLSACHHGVEDVAIYIASQPSMKNQPGLLDAAVGASYSLHQHRLLLLCLQSGARGPITDSALAKAVAAQQIELVDAFIKHNASVAHGEGKSILAAVASGRPELLQNVLKGRPPQIVLSMALNETVKLSDLRTAFFMTDLLLVAGVDAKSTSESLLELLNQARPTENQDARLKLIHLLLSKGQADVNWQEGRSLWLAVSQRRIDILSMLLRFRPNLKSLSTALKTAMGLDNSDLRRQIVNKIIESEPQWSTQLKRVAVMAASKNLHLEELQFLTTHGLSREDVLACFAATTIGNDQWLTAQGLEVVDFLLEQDPDIRDPVIEDAFCHAARLHQSAALDTLSFNVDPSVMNKALRSVLDGPRSWQSLENQSIIHKLLGWGCDGEPVNLLLIQIVDFCIKGKPLEDLLETILANKPSFDVNYKKGEALKVAIRAGHASMLSRLVQFSAKAETLTEAFATAITEPLDEKIVLALLDVLVAYGEKTGIVFDVKRYLNGSYPPIASCLRVHPQSIALARRLISLECDTEATFLTQLYGEKESGEELSTVLSWALKPRGKSTVTPIVIEALIDAKANVNFVSPKSRATPLLMVAKYGRSDVAAKLLSAKANPSARDSFGKTPLFYASQKGDLTLVKHLVAGKARENDGSLHEAARNLQPMVVEALIKGKHDANFRSHAGAHEGRTALQELVLKCDGAADDDRLHDTIQALDRGKASALEVYRGKNALFLALENPSAYAVTLALIERCLWRVLNHEKNVFVTLNPQTGTRHHYSATMYLQKLYTGKTESVRQLLALLYDKGCEDRFFIAEFGHDEVSKLQPPGAVGVPDKMADEDKRRRAEAEKQRIREQEHQQKLRREEELALQKDALEQRRHTQQLNQATMTHQTKLNQQVQMADQQLYAAQRKKELNERRGKMLID